MTDDNLSIWEKISRFATVAYEVWKSVIQVILLFFTLGITSGIAGFFINNALVLIIGTGVFIVTGIILIILATSANSTRFEVKVKKKYVTYKYFPDNSTMEHTKSYQLMSLKENLDKFFDRYAWSCNRVGRCTVTLLTPNQELVERRDGTWNINEIVFDPPLQKGQRVEVALKWDLYCEGNAVPFLSQIIDHKTDYLELAVTVPYKPAEIKLIHFNSGEGILTDPSSIVEQKDGVYISSTGEIRYAINKPKQHHKYMIRWTPSKAKSMPTAENRN